MHAYHFTHVVEQGDKTTRSEKLGLFEKVQVLLTGVKVPQKRNDKNPGMLGYAYKTVTIHGAEFQTPVWEIGHPKPKRTVLLFHGFGSRKADLLSVAGLMRKHLCRLVLVDLPGHGDSPYNWSTLGHREADVVYDVY